MEFWRKASFVFCTSHCSSQRRKSDCKTFLFLSQNKWERPTSCHSTNIQKNFSPEIVGVAFFFFFYCLFCLLFGCTRSQLWHVGSSVMACGIQFPEQGLNLGPLLWDCSLIQWTTREGPTVYFKEPTKLMLLYVMHISGASLKFVSSELKVTTDK